MRSEQAFRRDLMVSGCVMAAGAAMIIIPRIVILSLPPWWPKTASLLIVCGAVAELIAVTRFVRRK
jgi:hypothetical protein